MGGGEGLVEVQMDHVKAHVTRTDHAHDCVEICAVIVAQAAGIMNDFGDFQNVFVKQSYRIRVRQH